MKFFPSSDQIKQIPLQNGPVAGHRIVFGLDWGNSFDRMGVAIIDATIHQLVALNRCAGLGYEIQRARISELYRIWKPLLIYVEAASIGGPTIEALQVEGLPIYPLRMDKKTRVEILNNLAMELSMKRLAVVPDEVLLDELSTYEYQIGVQGNIRYLPGKHTETVIATALALHGTRYGGISIRFA